MLLPVYPLTVDLKAPTDDSPLAGARVVAILDRTEIDGAGYVVQRRVEAETDAHGVAVLSLWPNTRGSGQSRYTLFAIDANRQPLFEVALQMPARAAHAAEVTGPPIPRGTSIGDELRSEIQAMRADVMAASRAAITARDDAMDARDEAAGLLDNAPLMTAPPTKGGPYVAIGTRWVSLSDYLSGGERPTDEQPAEALSVGLDGQTTADTTPTITGQISRPGAKVRIRVQPDARLAITAGDVTTAQTRPMVGGSVSQGNARIRVEVAQRGGLAVSANGMTTNDRTPTVSGDVSRETARIKIEVAG